MFVVLEHNIIEYTIMGNNKTNVNLKMKEQWSTEPISVFWGEANFAFWLQ